MKNSLYFFIKRVFDLCVSIVALPFFAIIYVFVAIAIKLEDGGPVFYYDHRIAKGNKEFIMYKFRSMKVNSPMILNADGSSYNSDKDPRVTKIGHFLRKTSLDETPQILNILKGDMSLIGPRASTWDNGTNLFLPDEIDKMKVKPGITGYTQAYYRNSISNREKRLLDAWYANNCSLWLDIRIFFKTISTVLKKENLYTNTGSPEESDKVLQETINNDGNHTK